jgi:Lon protease-like protein
MAVIFSTVDELGLFPLNLVLLPGEQAPLHIFEPRYRELIGECLEDGKEFGLVLADDDGMRDVGTRAGVVEVLERFPDGRLNVVVEGRDRFRLVELTEGRAFATAEVDEIEDEGETPSDDEVEECLAAYHRVVEAAEADLEDLDFEADSIAFQIAARVDFGTEIKQGLLELRSERERVIRLAPMLSRAAEAVAREKEITERASGNGRVEPL